RVARRAGAVAHAHEQRLLVVPVADDAEVRLARCVERKRDDAGGVPRVVEADGLAARLHHRDAVRIGRQGELELEDRVDVTTRASAERGEDRGRECDTTTTRHSRITASDAGCRPRSWKNAK